MQRTSHARRGAASGRSVALARCLAPAARRTPEHLAPARACAAVRSPRAEANLLAAPARARVFALCVAGRGRAVRGWVIHTHAANATRSRSKLARVRTCACMRPPREPAAVRHSRWLQPVVDGCTLFLRSLCCDMRAWARQVAPISRVGRRGGKKRRGRTPAPVPARPGHDDGKCVGGVAWGFGADAWPSWASRSPARRSRRLARLEAGGGIPSGGGGEARAGTARRHRVCGVHRACGLHAGVRGGGERADWRRVRGPAACC